MSIKKMKYEVYKKNYLSWFPETGEEEIKVMYDKFMEKDSIFDE